MRVALCVIGLMLFTTLIMVSASSTGDAKAGAGLCIRLAILWFLVGGMYVRRLRSETLDAAVRKVIAEHQATGEAPTKLTKQGEGNE